MALTSCPSCSHNFNWSNLNESPLLSRRNATNVMQSRYFGVRLSVWHMTWKVLLRYSSTNCSAEDLCHLGWGMPQTFNWPWHLCPDNKCAQIFHHAPGIWKMKYLYILPGNGFLMTGFSVCASTNAARIPSLRFFFSVFGVLSLCGVTVNWEAKSYVLRVSYSEVWLLCDTCMAP